VGESLSLLIADSKYSAILLTSPTQLSKDAEVSCPKPNTIPSIILAKSYLVNST
jgi:hypothetical protein